MARRVGGGRYLLLERRGSGGVGEVWVAEDERLERKVAVKILLHTAARMDERFRREALATASLHHPNIVFVSDYFIEDGAAHIVMELLEGVSLAELLNAFGPLAAERAVKLLLDVCAALRFAHERGIVHRDIKPGNIQIVPVGDQEERAKVFDFGIAKLLDATTLTADGTTIGTPAFMAPEQARGAGVGPHTDVYAAGMTLYYALSGKLPYSGKTPAELLRQLTQGERTPLSSVHPSLDPTLVRIVERAIEPDPTARFTSADELAAALASWLGVSLEPTLAAPVDAEPHASRSSRWGVHALVAIAALLAAALAVLLWRQPEAPVDAPAQPSTPPPPPVVLSSLAPPADTPALSASVTPPPKPASTRPPKSVQCERPLWACSGRCVDLEQDRLHCGACNRSCPVDGVCLSGRCIKCPLGVGFSLCNGRCIPTLSDPKNCGDCGRVCPWGRCQAGRCQ